MSIAWNKAIWYLKWIALIIFLAMPFLGFYLGMSYQKIKQAGEAKNCIVGNTPRADTPAPWKTYRDEKYGLEFQYPSDLTMEPLAEGGLRIYNAALSMPPNATGQDARTAIKEVVFAIGAYSEKSMRDTQDRIDKEIVRQDQDLSLKHGESIVNTALGIKGYDFQTGAVGPYFEALFHNEHYMFDVIAIDPHGLIAKQILSTLKFTK
jgi:hypothetical protein